MTKAIYRKTFATHDENIAKMCSRGIVINDIEKAKEYLADIGYYRLGYYIFPFEQTYPRIGSRRCRDVKNGTTIEDIVAFYYYNVDLRNILNKYLSRIEVAVRSAIVYELSNKYNNDPFWFADENILDAAFIRGFKILYGKNIKGKEPIQRFHRKYEGDFAPVWKTMEYTTLGNLEMLYQNLLSNTDKCLVSNRFGEPAFGKFGNYLAVMREVRNACAHGAIIVGLALTNSVMAGSRACPYLSVGTQNTLGGALRIIEYMLRQISPNRAIDMQEELVTATEEICTKVPYLQPLIEQKTGIILSFSF